MQGTREEIYIAPNKSCVIATFETDKEPVKTAKTNISNNPLIGLDFVSMWGDINLLSLEPQLNIVVEPYQEIGHNKGNVTIPPHHFRKSTGVYMFLHEVGHGYLDRIEGVEKTEQRHSIRKREQVFCEMLSLDETLIILENEISAWQFVLRTLAEQGAPQGVCRHATSLSRATYHTYFRSLILEESSRLAQKAGISVNQLERNIQQYTPHNSLKSPL